MTEIDMLGAVLVGGRSRRMGFDKALASWHGRPLALAVADRLRRVVPRVVLVGGAGRGYERLGLPHVPDRPGVAGRGPLAGLWSALALGPGGVLLVGCDMPLVDAAVLRRLIAAAGGAPACMVEMDGRLHPLPGVYRPEATRAIAATLSQRSGRMADLLRVPGARAVPGAALGPLAAVRRTLVNLNEAGDLERPGGGGEDPAGADPGGPDRAEICD